jgi:hypothetical protein
LPFGAPTWCELPNSLQKRHPVLRLDRTRPPRALSPGLSNSERVANRRSGGSAVSHGVSSLNLVARREWRARSLTWCTQGCRRHSVASVPVRVVAEIGHCANHRPEDLTTPSARDWPS